MSLNVIEKVVLRLLWPTYMKTNGHVHSFRLFVKHFFIQRVFMINSHVPWPVHPTSQIKAVQKIVRGSRTPGLGLNCYIDARNGIILGDNVLIGPKVSIISMNHDISDFENYVIGKPIIIGNDCWLGAGCIILPEVILGPKTIVGAGTVVTKSFPEGEQLLVGNPARIVKKI